MQQHQTQPNSQPNTTAFASTPLGTPTSRPVIEANSTAIGNAGEISGRANGQDCDGLNNKGSYKEQVGVDISVSRRLNFGSQMSHIVADNDNNAGIHDGGVLRGNVPRTRASDIAEAQSELPADVDRSSSQMRTHTAERAVNRFPASSNADGDELFRWSRVHRGRVLPTVHQPENTANGGGVVAGKRQASDRDWSSPDRLRRKPTTYYTSHRDTAGAPAGPSASKMADPVHENGSAVGGSVLTRSRLGAMTRGEQLVALAGGTLPVLAQREQKAEKIAQDEAGTASNGVLKKGLRRSPEEAEVEEKGCQEAAEGAAQQSAGSSTKLLAE